MATTTSPPDAPSIDNLTVVTDAPAAVDTPADEPPRSRFPVAKFGTFDHGTYGKFSITPAMYEQWGQNLHAALGGRVAIDFDHSPEHGHGTAAAGWIVRLDADDVYVWATVEWTPRGAQAIRDKTYQYISPTFHERYTDEHGNALGHALIGAGLTNRPHLRSLPVLSLSQGEVTIGLGGGDSHIDPYREDLDRRARVLMAERGLDPLEPDDYMQAVEAVSADATIALDEAPATPKPQPKPVRPAPDGDVDEHGYVILDPALDPDELIADPVAAAKAWRVVREERLGDYPDDDRGRARFEDEWRSMLNVRRDLVQTLRLTAYQGEQSRLAFKQRLRDEAHERKQSRKARVEKKRRELQADLDSYAAHLADLEHENEVAVLKAQPMTFDQWRQRQR